MSRQMILLALALALLGAGCVGAASKVPPAAAGSPGFDYAGTDHEGRATRTHADIVPSAPGTRAVRATTAHAGAGITERSMVMDAETLAVLRIDTGDVWGSVTFEPAFAVLQPAMNHTWRGDVRSDAALGVPQGAHARVTFYGTETTRVPAGVFATQHYLAILDVGAWKTSSMELWYAPTLGMNVKTVVDGDSESLVAYR